jgi:hypothetical protein
MNKLIDNGKNIKLWVVVLTVMVLLVVGVVGASAMQSLYTTTGGGDVDMYSDSWSGGCSCGSNNMIAWYNNVPHPGWVHWTAKSYSSGVGAHSCFSGCGGMAYGERCSGVSYVNANGVTMFCTSGHPYGKYCKWTLDYSAIPPDQYTVSGSYDCISDVYLYKKYFGDYVLEDEDNTGSYSFDIVNGSSYRIIFSDSTYHDFVCTGNEVFNYNACTFYTLNLLDDCANPLINPTTTIFKDMTDIIYEGTDNPIQLVCGRDVQIGDYINVVVDTHDGAILFNDYVSEIEKDVHHNFVDWYLTVNVVDDQTSSPISAKISHAQPCTVVTGINHALGSSTSFTGLSNSNVPVTVEKDGYVTYNVDITLGFEAFCPGGSFTVYLNSTGGSSTDDYQNGTHNDSENVGGTGNQTLPEDNPWGCGVYFKDTTGKITSTIKDTDAYVDMYWWAKGKGCDTYTLKFQYQLYTYWYTGVEYIVLNNSYEYRRILNDNFSDYTKSYRGYLYNSTCDCNSIQKLNVINQSYQNESNYANLSASCRFKGKKGGNQIDFREDVIIYICANSDNSTLLFINASLMNQSTLVDSKSLNWADFSGTPKWRYKWYPNYDYASGFNYTVNITGYDGYCLDTDEIWTSDIRGNTLHVYVKDTVGNPLTNCYVYIEGWGQINTGNSNYICISGLPSGHCNYKATKTGYISQGWEDVTFTDSDISVNIVLRSVTGTASISGIKMNDKEIKAIFIPLIMMLWILIIFGAVKYVGK